MSWLRSELIVIVTDAGYLTVALAIDDASGDQARTRLRGQDLAAPELIDLEVTSALRRLVRVKAVSLPRAQDALAGLSILSIERASHRSLLDRCWQLRDNLTIYDAAYVALAEELGTPLLTADRRLSRATGLRCQVEVL
jgi:predicted nucleic acid-binding protein